MNTLPFCTKKSQNNDFCNWFSFNSKNGWMAKFLKNDWTTTIESCYVCRHENFNEHVLVVAAQLMLNSPLMHFI